MRLLFLGGAYGSILATKCALAGHKVDVVCRAQEAENINSGSLVIHFPGDKGRSIGISECQSNMRGVAARHVEPSDYDLCFLCMQEPQFAEDTIASLLLSLESKPIPLISLMNMPLPPYLLGRFGIDLSAEPSVWKNTDLWGQLSPDSFTASSPDPQAVVEVTDDVTRVHVSLASNLKIAPFSNQQYQNRLTQLAIDVNDLRITDAEGRWSPGIKLVPHESPYVPLAKWPMLITGNFRCIGPTNAKTIRSAVWDDLERSRSIYEWVTELCQKLVVSIDKYCDLSKVLIPFDRYADAAQQLVYPSSVSRGLLNNATEVERVDRLIQGLARSLNAEDESLNSIVSLVDETLMVNRSVSAAR